jgi:hypothetical protein
VGEEEEKGRDEGDDVARRKGKGKWKEMCRGGGRNKKGRKKIKQGNNKFNAGDEGKCLRETERKRRRAGKS